MAESKAEQRRKLLEQELDHYVRVLKTHENPHKLSVFGSLASGQVHEWSDIDLVVVNDTELPYLERLIQTQGLLHPWVGTDIFYYTPEEFAKLCRERIFFREEILDKGKVLYERVN